MEELVNLKIKGLCDALEQLQIALSQAYNNQDKTDFNKVLPRCLKLAQVISVSLNSWQVASNSQKSLDAIKEEIKTKPAPLPAEPAQPEEPVKP